MVAVASERTIAAAAHAADFAGAAHLPPWWPAFCLAFDVGAAVALAWLLRRGSVPTATTRREDRESAALYRLGADLRRHREWSA